MARVQKLNATVYWLRKNRPGLLVKTRAGYWPM